VKHVGFIINSRVPELASLRKGMPPHAFAFGWDDSGSPMSFMRFRWIAEALRGSGWHYEVYRPWRRYDVVVFLKSMGPHCLALAKRLRERGTRIVFEANVDYYTRFEGAVRLDAMIPSAQQRADAVALTAFSDTVIASSRHLASVCAEFNPSSAWVPDNVNLRLRPAHVQREPLRDGRLQVWWSGMAAKLFEFLAAEEAFLTLADRIHLRFVTDDLERAKDRWPIEVRERLEHFLARMPHTVHRFCDISGLLAHYAEGGVIVSPRFLDTPYNLSHTEWKITLGMACELPAIASPVPSYLEAAEHSAPNAVTICRANDEWHAALEACLKNPKQLRESGRAAFQTVRQHYETDAVARQHVACLSKTLARS
jgi:glycosyltransferase involved in cell wall biosynthesis